MSNNSGSWTGFLHCLDIHDSIESANFTAPREVPPLATNISSSVMFSPINFPGSFLNLPEVILSCLFLPSFTIKLSCQAYFRNSLEDFMSAATEIDISWTLLNKAFLSIFPWAVIGRWETMWIKSGWPSTGNKFSRSSLSDLTFSSSQDHEWPRVTTSDHEWPRMTTSDHEWPRVDHEWPRVTTSDHEWDCIKIFGWCHDDVIISSFCQILTISRQTGRFL